jgi:hypothetical protein
MTDWAKEALGFLFIIVCVIAFMFFFPILYDRFGKAAALILSLGFFYLCFWIWSWAVGLSQRSE